MNWTNKVTSSNINVVLWAWAFVTELLATRTGMAPNLPAGELEARLQHFCHVLEITLQTSGQTDFVGDSWAVAKLYDTKVQQKVDSKMFSWVQLSEINHGASLPHELIAANQELTKKITAPKGGTGKPTYGKEKERQERQERPSRSNLSCGGWNTCDIRGKCKWEVDNDPEKCNRAKSHQCSWCKAKKLTPVNHQRSFCQKRLDEEG